MPKHAEVSRWELYDDDGNLDGKNCPRCGSVLAVHDNRETYGKCGYSKIQKD